MIETASAQNVPSASKLDRTGAQSEIDPKLDKAAHDMEGYFVGMLLKQMHTAAAKGGLFDSGSESSTYREMFDEAVAGEIGKRGAFGIADTLYKELMIRGNAVDAGVKGAENGGK